ncbi:flagellar brake protein [Pectinatus cerevisiiphilus]|uniref:C-di-GMP-binding flagellar brake protein YcgR n=1 Tax=Pectinatus cerevisiiphilus TaxID=86956 RepID=A0A4R3KCK6_9FIRM|nr:flagellar brake domain-containing protein [Pectinatus cerevisiiphilus]TCS80964.1 c-di-GMP-binding flagellar brake protein YcgR [Pectinatus cerevisiiphilus]
MKDINVFETKKVLRIGQRVEIDKIDSEDDEPSEVYASRIEDIKGSMVFLALPVDSMLRPVILETGQTVEGRIIDDKVRVYSFTAQYERIGRVNIPVWIVEMAPTVIRNQHREFVRIRVSIPIQVAVAEQDGSMEVPFHTHSVDVSGNGISFLSAEALQPGTMLTIETIPIPSVGRIHTFVEVKRCILSQDKQSYLIGGKFTDLSKQIQNKLVKYLFSRQREFIKKGIIPK